MISFTFEKHHPGCCIKNRWLDFEYNLKMKPGGFSAELDVGCER